MDPYIEKFVKKKFMIWVIIALVPFVFIFCFMLLAAMLLAAGSGSSSGAVAGMQKQTAYAQALRESIVVYTRTGVEFEKIFAVYCINTKDIEKFDSLLLRDIESKLNTGVSIDTMPKSKADYKTLVEMYKNAYSELVSKFSKDGKNNYFYNCYFPIGNQVQPLQPPAPSTAPTSPTPENPYEERYAPTTPPGATPAAPSTPPMPSPISVIVNYSDDFMDPRDFGSISEHDGTDIMCAEGSPIICVESGTIETIGWNDAGGWRIGIRSQDGKRFWYYAHMRKVHPYVTSLSKGQSVTGGQVIGYVGSTGYSHNTPDNIMPDPVTLTNPTAVDKNFPEHLHFGLQIKAPAGSKEKDMWVDPYPVLQFLEKNKVNVNEQTAPADYTAVTKTQDERVFATK